MSNEITECRNAVGSIMGNDPCRLRFLINVIGKGQARLRHPVGLPADSNSLCRTDFPPHSNPSIKLPPWPLKHAFGFWLLAENPATNGQFHDTAATNSLGSSQSIF